MSPGAPYPQSTVSVPRTVLGRSAVTQEADQ